MRVTIEHNSITTEDAEKLRVLLSDWFSEDLSLHIENVGQRIVFQSA